MEEIKNLNLDCSHSNLINLVNMSHDPDTIFKALRLVPEFDGNPNILTRFIQICDHLAIQYLSELPGSEFSNVCLLNGILNKITGTAASKINSNGIPDSWLGIKTLLINNFSDQRDETALYNDLSLATQGNRSPQEFYDHCQNLFSMLMTYVTLHETLSTTIEAKRDLYRKVTMQAYVRGLKEPLGSRIRCMRPPTIEKALEYVQEELNTMYMHSRYEVSKSNKTVTSIPSATPHTFAPRTFPLSIPIQNRPNTQPFKFNNEHQRPRLPTHTQRMFGAPPPNYNPNSHMFRLPPRNSITQKPNEVNRFPRPMSGVSHFVSRPLPPTQPTLTGHNWLKYGNPPPRNYFKSREINFNNCEDDYDSYDYYTDFEPYYNSNEYIEYPYDYDYDYNYETYPQNYTDNPTTSQIESNNEITPTDNEQDFQKISKSDTLK